jgi:hypothetical protein
MADSSGSGRDMEARSRKDLYVSLVMLAAMVAMLILSYQLDPKGRMMPVLVAWAGIVLCALDAFGHTDSRAGRWVGMFLSDRLDLQKRPPAARRLSVEALACFWMMVALALMLVLGFILATPLYILGYMLIYGRRSFRQSAITAVVTTAFIWVVFEILLQYNLYRGILFEDY